jgi:hypothetical protein
MRKLIEKDGEEVIKEDEERHALLEKLKEAYITQLLDWQGKRDQDDDWQFEDKEKPEEATAVSEPPSLGLDMVSDETIDKIEDILEKKIEELEDIVGSEAYGEEKEEDDVTEE